MSTPQNSSSENPGKELIKKVKAELGQIEGTFALAFKDLSTGKEILPNEELEFHAASTMKVPVLIEAYKQAEEGKLSIQENVWVKNEFSSIVDGSLYELDQENDSEKDLYRKVGKTVLLYDLLYKMIIESSNLATNLVIDLIGAANVQRTMTELGAKKIKVRRGVEDQKAFQKSLNNTTTAYDLMLLFTGLAENRIVSKSASEEMIKILLDQKLNDIIPAGLPKKTRVAHKTGSITGVQHDSGIVFLPDGKKYVLVLLSKDLKNEKLAVQALSRVSALFYSHVSGNK